MPEITIIISDKLLYFLERYYPPQRPIGERFYTALADGYIEQHGQGWCLTADMRLKLEGLTSKDQDDSDG